MEMEMIQSYCEWRQLVLMLLVVVSALGAAYGTAKSGTGIAAMSVMRPELIMKSIIPVVMAGIIAIYGLVVAALIASALKADMTLFQWVSRTNSHIVELVFTYL